MTKNPTKRLRDSAKASIAGYLFQFESALCALAELDHQQASVSIEQVDDLATHESDGTVLLSVQAKHSLSSSGSTFSDTSIALWRTMEIWITKLESGVFTSDTKYLCATNKPLPSKALLRKLINQPFEDSLRDLRKLLKEEKAKLNLAIAADPNGGKSLKEIIRLINFAIKKKKWLQDILANLSVSDNEDIKERFFNRLNLGAERVTTLQKERTYDEFYGWLLNSCFAKWRNAKEARFTKKDFDNKWYYIQYNPAIITAIFRTKEALGSVLDHEILAKGKELFVRQIEDIKRNKEGKAKIIREAILNVIYTELEIKHVIDKGDFTQEDFDAFLDQCLKSWEKTFYDNVLKEVNEYSEDEKNSIAIQIFKAIMEDSKMEFKDGFLFSSSNQYVKNGCFLQLSNEPLIGWHPEWEIKYKINAQR